MIMKIKFTFVSFLFCLLIIQACKKVDSSLPPDDLTSAKGHGKNLKAVDIKLVAQNMVSPIGLVAIPDGSKRLAVIDQIGKVWIIDANGNTMPMPFIDVTSKMVALNPNYDERGLLGLAFHPNYKYNGRSAEQSQRRHHCVRP